MTALPSLVSHGPKRAELRVTLARPLRHGLPRTFALLRFALGGCAIASPGSRAIAGLRSS